MYLETLLLDDHMTLFILIHLTNVSLFKRQQMCYKEIEICTPQNVL